MRDTLALTSFFPHWILPKARENRKTWLERTSVTHRQRPATSRGIVFFNLEDETGLLNVVVLPEIWNEHRKVARRNPGLIIRGTLEYRYGVTNLVARGFVPLRD